MMKRRIVQILDLRHKRLGTVIVSLLLIATLGTGMAFAINTEGGVPADNESRVKALNNQLALSFSRWGALSTIDPDIGSYQFAFEEVSEADYLALMGMLQELYTLPQEEATKAWQMIRSFEVQVPTAPPELYTAVDTLIAATGYDVQAEGEYVVAAESYASQMLTWEPPAIAGSWTVEVDWQDEDALRSVLTVFDQDGQWTLQDMQLFSGIYYLTPDPIEGLLTDAQRASAKARAAEFVGAHMMTVDPTCQHMIASDHVFTYWTEEGFIGEPCALVWVFETAWGDTSEPFYALPYEQPGVGEGNRGYKLVVELGSGRIVAVERFVNETAFVNEYWAETEWVALGHEYPYPDGSYIANTISPWVFAMVHDYLVAYGAELTEEDRMLSGFIAGSRNSLCSDSDWRGLLADLQSVQSAADFQAVLHSDYIGINHPWEEMLSRDEIVALIMPSIEALGYGDMRQHMSIEYENTRQPEEAIVYMVKISDTLFPNNPIPLPGQEADDVPSPMEVETVRIEMDGQGNLLSIRNSGMASSLMTEREGLREMTEDEEALLMETARMMAESHLGGYEDIDLKGMQYFRVVNTSRTGRQVAKMHIPFGEVDERESLYSSGEYVRNKIVLGVDMETGAVLSMVTDRTEIDPDGELPAMYWN